MDFDFRDFNDALARYMAVTPRRLEEVINKKAAFIITEARALTPIADRGAIEAAFGVSYDTHTKTGKIRKRRKILSSKPQDSRVALVLWRLRLQGKPIPSNAVLQRLAQGLPGRRLRAVGSDRQGWRRALSIMARAAGTFADTSGPRVSHPGSATPAAAGWDPIAEWQFDLATVPPGSAPTNSSASLQIDPRVEQALAQAFTHETASMEQYIREQLQPDADAVSAK